MGQDTELYLAVVRVHQHAVLGGEELAQLPAYWGAHGDVLHIGLGAGYAPGAGLGLVKAGMYAPVGAYHLQEPVAVGGLELCHRAVTEYLVNYRVHGPQGLQHVGAGGPAGLGLLAVGQAELFKKGLAKLLWGVDVEVIAHLLDYGAMEGLDLGLELFAVLPDASAVYIEAGMLHLGQYEA